jgi:enterochelin esterase-like enzyme
MVRCLLLLASLFLSPALAQTPAARPVQSHQVNPDGSITFRYVDPAATKVEVSVDVLGKPLAMARDTDGVWSVTTAAMAPEIYGYSFTVDGRHAVDPLSVSPIRNLLSLNTSVTVPATPPAPWELTAIAHGRLDHHMYTTHVAKNLPVGQESYVVYTPPGYDAKRKGGYPVLYLLHGWSDDEYGWTAVGNGQYILDNLIDSGKAVPMIVVMPLGYGDYDFVTHGFSVWQDAAQVNGNASLDSQMLLTEIVPAIDREYNVAAGRENRAIAGLSMGGRESVTIGLNHTDQFAWVGGFSAAVFNEGFNQFLPDGITAKAANLRLLWIACGTEEPLLKANRDLVVWTRAHGLETVAIEIPGRHTWPTWRDNLVHFAPLLFQKK